LRPAVGLGNIWKFPSLTGTNGGAAFIFIYVIATLLVGLPVMISEHVIGRTTRANAITSFTKLANAPVVNAFFTVVKFVTSVLLVLVLLNGLQIIK